jgi:hypothetical protein
MLVQIPDSLGDQEALFDEAFTDFANKSAGTTVDGRFPIIRWNW